MNYRQKFSYYDKEEHFELIRLGLLVKESRQRRVVFTGARWVRNRRRGYQAHFVNDRRDGRHDLVRRISLLTYGVVLVTVSAATWSFVVVAPQQLGMPVMFFHLTALAAVYLFKPYNKFSRASA